MRQFYRYLSYPVLLCSLCLCRSMFAAEPMIPPVLLQMIRDPAIQAEIKATDAQVGLILEATDGLDPRWISSRNLRLADQNPLLRKLTSQLEESLDSILTVEQRKRVDELVWQALGTRAVVTSKLASRLKIDPVSLARMRAFAIETDTVVERGEASWGMTGEFEVLAEELRRAQERELKGILGSLAPSQQRAWDQALGQPFDFSRVKRTNPRMPDWGSGAMGEWLVGEAVATGDLRGKAVVVHFFSDQPAGCIENLPYYQKWLEEFAGAGLVVVGIFTPLPEDRRGPDTVREALAGLDIRYPVVFDPQSTHWNAWGNRTWPTAYLIDHQGFLRNLWEGEFNYEGSRGDQEFLTWIREVINERGE